MSKKLWAFSHIKGWYEVEDFFTEKDDLDDYLKSIGYDSGSPFYCAHMISGGVAIETYRQKGNSNLPEFIIALHNASDVDYFVAYELPSVIELINKLAPMTYAQEFLLEKSISYETKMLKKRFEDH